MKVLSKLLSLLLIVSLFLSFAAPAFAAEATPVPVPEGRREVIFWHCFGGLIGEAVQRVVDGFNASQNDIWVTAIFQGAYDDALTKLKAAMPAGTGPDMFQMFELGTTFLVNSGWTVPFQEMLEKDAEPYISIDNIEPALRNYYTYDGKMVCIPFNPSTPIMYFNKDVFKEAGLDPENPPTTFKEIMAIADKLTVKEGNRTTRYAMGLPIYGWFFENMLAGAGSNYVNNDNGRTGHATAIEFDQNGVGQMILENWKQMVDEGILYNYGADNGASRDGFLAGQTAITLESTAQLRVLEKGSEGKFELGTAYLPSMLDKTQNGVIIGGANLWLCKQDDEQRVNDAWTFIKYATSAPVAAQFSMDTGYFCANMTAYDQPEFQEYLKANPSFLTAINQLHDCPSNYATQGASVGVMPELRAIFQEEASLYLDDAQSIEDTLANLAAKSNAAIQSYNKTAYGE
ncbi:ABC transporter substrate-binding protein [Bacillota bacterium Meth-B3]|nr:ABC transporter substrate-binding protein [Christensenellaceae bacterium]MEA5064601.1 ABC transporter substrate-binding protein [Eubacteriales bacterium]